MLTLSVAGFLSALDKVIGLLKDRQVRRRDYFDKIIEPLYTQFVVVGEDYLKLFRDARESLEKASKKTTAEEKLKFLDQIRDRREEFLATRLRVRGLVDAFGSHAEKEKDKELLALLEAMSKFFYGSGYKRPLGSVGLQLIDLFSIWAKPEQETPRNSVSRDNRIAEAEYAREGAQRDLEKFVALSLQGLENAWFEAAGRYADLRMKYLGNKQF